MAAVKKSVYLSPDVIEALEATARREGRSMTKQLDVSLREGLRLHTVHLLGPLQASPPAEDRPAKPDPKIKAPRRSSRG